MQNNQIYVINIVQCLYNLKIIDILVFNNQLHIFTIKKLKLQNDLLIEKSVPKSILLSNLSSKPNNFEKLYVIVRFNNMTKQEIFVNNIKGKYIFYKF